MRTHFSLISPFQKPVASGQPTQPRFGSSMSDLRNQDDKFVATQKKQALETKYQAVRKQLHQKLESPVAEATVAGAKRPVTLFDILETVAEAGLKTSFKPGFAIMRQYPANISGPLESTAFASHLKTLEQDQLIEIQPVYESWLQESACARGDDSYGSPRAQYVLSDLGTRLFWEGYLKRITPDTLEFLTKIVKRSEHGILSEPKMLHPEEICTELYPLADETFAGRFAKIKTALQELQSKHIFFRQAGVLPFEHPEYSGNPPQFGARYQLFPERVAAIKHAMEMNKYYSNE